MKIQKNTRQQCLPEGDTRVSPDRCCIDTGTRDTRGEPSYGEKPNLRAGDISFAELARSRSRNVRPGSIERLAEKLCVTADSLRRLGVGYDTYGYTFPMRNGRGEIVGLRLRTLAGEKACIPRSKLGLFIPEGVTASNLQLLCEGESDTAAALSMGFAAIGTPGAGSCVEQVIAFLAGKAVSPLTIIADNDDAGRQGAAKSAKALLAAGITCRIVYPPDSYEDLRQWMCSGDMLPEDLQNRIENQPVQFLQDFKGGFQAIPNNLIHNSKRIREVGLKAWGLLIIIAARRGQDGWARITRQQLAETCGENPRTIDRLKRLLHAAGLLFWRKGHTGKANEYWVNLGPCPNLRNQPCPCPPLLHTTAKPAGNPHRRPPFWL